MSIVDIKSRALSHTAHRSAPARPPAIVLCQGLYVQVCVRPVAELDHLHTPGEGSHQAAGGPGGEGHVGHLQHSAPGTRGGYSHGSNNGGGKSDFDEKRGFLVNALSFCSHALISI